jgi:hypothetical protein
MPESRGDGFSWPEAFGQGNLICMDLEPAATVAAVIDVWNGSPVDRLHGLLAPDYRGHMLHVSDGERDAPAYPVAIHQYRAANPGTTFRIVEQLAAGVRLVTRLEARRVDEASRAALVSRGINVSRFDAQGRLAEEWAIWSAWLDESSLGPEPVTSTLDDAKSTPPDGSFRVTLPNAE